MRKLNKKELMIISRILNDINFKMYAEYLLNIRIEKLLKSDLERKERMLILMGDISVFICQNIFKAEENTDLLFMSYLNITQEQIDNMEVDEYIDNVKNIFMAGIPKIISSYINIGELKKKLTELKK